MTYSDDSDFPVDGDDATVIDLAARRRSHDQANAHGRQHFWPGDEFEGLPLPPIDHPDGDWSLSPGFRGLIHSCGTASNTGTSDTRRNPYSQLLYDGLHAPPPERHLRLIKSDSSAPGDRPVDGPA